MKSDRQSTKRARKKATPRTEHKKAQTAAIGRPTDYRLAAEKPAGSQPVPPAQSDLNALIAQAKAREVEPTGGRPSLYRPEWCDVVVALAHMGKGLNHLSRLLGVDRTTISEWITVHEAFSQSCRLARSIRASVLEDGLEGQARAHDVHWRLRVLANIAADDFKDRASVAVGGDSDLPPLATVAVSADQVAAFLQLKAEIDAKHRVNR